MTSRGSGSSPELRPQARRCEGRRSSWRSGRVRSRPSTSESEPEEFISVGNKVVAPMRMVAHGSGSEIDLVSVVTWVSSFDDGGLCTKVEAYESRDEALRATGIRTSA